MKVAAWGPIVDTGLTEGDRVRELARGALSFRTDQELRAPALVSSSAVVDVSIPRCRFWARAAAVAVTVR
jgi:hypothetical protein